MCLQITERYSVCKCLYYRHSVDPCAARGQRGHGVREKTVLVGYACDAHARIRGVVTAMERGGSGFGNWRDGLRGGGGGSLYC